MGIRTRTVWVLCCLFFGSATIAGCSSAENSSPIPAITDGWALDARAADSSSEPDADATSCSADSGLRSDAIAEAGADAHVQDASIAPVYVHFHGDSITAGSGLLPEQSYPTIAGLELGSRFSVFDRGTGGETLATMVANGSSEVDAYLQPGHINVAVLLGGINDIRTGVATLANMSAAWSKYAADRKSAGWDWVIVGTMLDDATAIPGSPQDDLRLQLNAWIRTNWHGAGYDDFFDPGNDPILGSNATMSTSTWTQPDHVHPQAAGAAILGTLAVPVVRRVTN